MVQAQKVKSAGTQEPTHSYKLQPGGVDCCYHRRATDMFLHWAGGFGRVQPLGELRAWYALQGALQRLFIHLFGIGGSGRPLLGDS